MPHLPHIDSRPVPDSLEELRLFTYVRDEITRLPYFLEYYRKLGIDRFFFIDDGSKDQTVTYLLQQPDCHVFKAVTTFKNSNGGVLWREDLLTRYGTGHWCLSVDADELFAYPYSETVSLKTFCKYLEQQGSEGVFAFLLDMYPSGPLSEAVCISSIPFEKITPYFDKDYTFVDRIHLRGEAPFPKIEVIGGPRCRCFYGYQGENSPLWRFCAHLIERSVTVLRHHGIPIPHIRIKGTPLFKVPLVKWKSGNAYTASTHQINPIQLSSVQGVLLHFKFFSDFHDRAVKAAQEGQYSQGSAEYKRYLKRADKINNLMYEGSIYYNSTKDLLDHNLIKTTPDYEEFIK